MPIASMPKSRKTTAATALPWIAPQLATLTASAPTGPDWFHEIKYDGYRLLARVDAAGVRLLTRNQKDWTARYPEIATSLSVLEPAPLLVDGEVAVELETGVTSFQALQNAERNGSRAGLRYYAFDLLFAGGEDLRGLSLSERKSRLENILREVSSSSVRYSDHVRGNGGAFYEQACRHGLEGIISKRSASPYRSGRGADWLKVKCVRKQEFVVGGFTAPGGSRADLGALHVGAFEDGRLVYRGKVGTGFSAAMLRELRRRLDPLRRPTTPFANGPTGAAARGTTWVEPKLVAQVRFTEWTADGRLRHPSFTGLREDREVTDVSIETVQRRPRQRSQRRASARKKDAAVDIAGVRLTSPGRIVYPDDGITKAELARYYERIGDAMLPYVTGRPLTLIRCPDDITQCFFQKHIDRSRFYTELERVPVRETKGVRYYPAVHTVRGLISLVQLGVVEFHTLGARSDAIEKPDRFTLDLDPDPDLPWSRVVRAARAIGEVLAGLGLQSFVKTTGGKGLHVVVPITRRSSWDAVRDFSRAIASLLVEASPDAYTIRVSKARRKGKILIDYLRNARGSVAVAAYSARARPGAPVSLPIGWEDLGRTRPDRHDIRTVVRTIDRREDPWSGYGSVRQSITASMKRAVGLGVR